MPDQTPGDVAIDETALSEDDALYCADCGHLITRGRWRIRRNGDHEHTVFNSAGIVYRVVCFKEAPGVATRGDPSGEFTWFKGYAWRIANCTECGLHLGWRFEGEDVFFGLVRTSLIQRED